MCILRQKPLEEIAQPRVKIERRMQHTKSVLSRGFERLLDPFIGDHRVALASGTHCCNGASGCSVKGIKFGEEMGRVIFHTLANTRMIHAEKATTPERYLELLIVLHKSRSIYNVSCFLWVLNFASRSGLPSKHPLSRHTTVTRDLRFLFPKFESSLCSLHYGTISQLLYVFRQEICVLTLNLANTTALHYRYTQLNNEGGLGVCMGVLAAFQTSLPGGMRMRCWTGM